jgi:UTP:GlnB (protein PII) uridylyltransferase
MVKPVTLSDLAIQFRDSMPAGYLNAFSESDIEEHAQIARDRGNQTARVVVWRNLTQGMAILCVVTEDRPGLVALVSSAFLAHALDVRAAQIYCRSLADDRVEAVDFFWLRNVAGGSPEPSRLEACARTIQELVDTVGAGPELQALQPARPDGQARISYSPDLGMTDHWEVTLEARDFPGLLHTVARLLHQHGLEVVRCEIRTEEGIARDRFFVACFTGAPAEPALQLFRSSLLNVIDAVGKSAG